MTSVLFVCMGNICRSPTAEGVMRRLVDEAGLGDEIELDSAGTGSWHIGHPPDPRTCAEAERRGTDLRDLRARQVERADFERFDRIVAMDHDNLRQLRRLAPDDAARARVTLLRSHDPAAVEAGDLDVPDPYYGEGDGFVHVYDVVEAGCRGLLNDLRD